MSNQVEQIRAGLAKLESENNCGTDDFIEAKRIAFQQVREVIDALPKEQPEADFDAEFERFLDDVEGVPRMYHSDEQMEWGKDLARHFAEWGVEHLRK